jgi:hypothetical protein
MGNTSIVDMRHYLDEETGDFQELLPDPILTPALFFGSIVAWVTDHLPDGDPRTNVPCKRSPDHKRCLGEIAAELDSASGHIVWHCPTCGDDGVIHGWENTKWDRRGGAPNQPTRREQAPDDERLTPTFTVLGIDLASSAWSSNGSATISINLETNTFERVIVPAMTWPNVPLTAVAMADAIDAFARKNSICAISLDGPQGWRDPATPVGQPGVGRRCEYKCKTQGKTGVYPQTFPSNQRPWIQFCIDVFRALLTREGVQLADPASLGRRLATGYVLLECYPTSAWCSSGLPPLPGKSKRPTLAPYIARLAHAYDLPVKSDSLHSHDDLQAVVAALAAVAVVGGPAFPLSKGIAGKSVRDGEVEYRVEGLIWNVRPVVSKRVLSDPRCQEPLQRVTITSSSSASHRLVAR